MNKANNVDPPAKTTPSTQTIVAISVTNVNNYNYNNNLFLVSYSKSSLVTCALNIYKFKCITKKRIKD